MMHVTPMTKHNALSLSMMMKGQLATNGIHDPRVIEALSNVDRAQFVPESLKGVAYVDDDIKLCNGRFLLEPLVFARMLVHADIDRTHHVLDVGAGLGYSCAVLAKLAKHVVGIEENAELVAIARKKFMQLAMKTIDVVAAPITAGCNAHKPYDRIVIEGAFDVIPTSIEEQLVEGGRIVALRSTGTMFATQKGLATIVVGTKHDNIVTYVEKERVSAYFLQRFVTNEVFVF